MLFLANVQMREEVAKQERYYRALVESVVDHVVVLDADGRPLYASPALLRLVGLEFGQLVDESGVPRFVEAEDLPGVAAAVQDAVAHPGATVESEVRVRDAAGDLRDLVGLTTSLLDEPAVGGIVVVLHDVTDRKRLEDELRHQALHDTLTGLPNRALVHDRLEQLLSVAGRRGDDRSVAALFVDLDKFKDVNDSLGHLVGDALLRAVARRLRAGLRESNTVGRFGGDEFVVLTDGEPLAGGAERVAKRILDLLREPFVLPEAPRTPLIASASIGVAHASGSDPEQLLRNADVALYRAKAEGRRRYVVFESGMYEQAQARLRLELDLQEALESGQFFLLYQPTYDLRTLVPTGAEALLRWQHPTRGLIEPCDFIPALEENGLIVEVGERVLQEACRRAAEWQHGGMALPVSVNVSALQIEAGGLVAAVDAALSASGLEPRMLVLEITESTLLRDTPATDAVLRGVKELGVRIAIDDFGTGFASFSYLRRFPIDVLKIDRSFVAGIAKDEQGLTLVRSLVGLGRKLGLVTLAEGIERPEELTVLQRERCDSGQGYLLSPPVSAEALEELIGVRAAACTASTSSSAS